MPAHNNLIRIPVFFTSPVLVRLDDSAHELRTTRSALIRAAVHRGFSMAVRDLRKRKVTDDRVTPRAAHSAAPPRPVPAPGPLDLEEAVSQLCSYVEAIRASGRTIPADSLRDVLETHASTLRIDPDVFDDVVGDAFARVSSDDSLEGLPAGPLDPHQPPE